MIHEVMFTVKLDKSFIAAIRWCKENFGEESITNNRMMFYNNPYSVIKKWMYEYNMYGHSTVIFKFTNIEDATLFKLVWCC